MCGNTHLSYIAIRQEEYENTFLWHAYFIFQNNFTLFVCFTFVDKSALFLKDLLYIASSVQSDDPACYVDLGFLGGERERRERNRERKLMRPVF